MLKFKKLLNTNNISMEDFCDAFYNEILLNTFTSICDFTQNNHELVNLKMKLQVANNSLQEILVIKNYVSQTLNMHLSNEELTHILKLTKIFLSKNNYRKSLDENKRKLLLLSQNGRCNLCPTKLDKNNLHIDHKIPFKYVGDLLEDNYQLLCNKCNFKKGCNTFQLPIFLKNLSQR